MMKLLYAAAIAGFCAIGGHASALPLKSGAAVSASDREDGSMVTKVNDRHNRRHHRRMGDRGHHSGWYKHDRGRHEGWRRHDRRDRRDGDRDRHGSRDRDGGRDRGDRKDRS